MFRLVYIFVLLWLGLLTSILFFANDETRVGGAFSLFILLSILGLVGLPLIFICIYLFLWFKRKNILL